MGFCEGFGRSRVAGFCEGFCIGFCVGFGMSRVPGIEPVDCMRVYGRQIEPVVGVALRVPVERLDVASLDAQERAVAHAELGRWVS